jgi:hypothetical protein
MIGLIARHEGNIVIVTGRTQEEAEEIALQLFMEKGCDLHSVEMIVLVFDPMEPGGILLEIGEGRWTSEGWHAN